MYVALSIDLTHLHDGDDLLGRDLRGAIVTGTAPTPLDLAGRDLTGAVFTDADLGVGADFSDCLLDGAVFSRTRARAARFDGASLAGAEFQHSSFPRASFVDVGAPRLRIHRSDLSYSVFSEADLQHATLRGAVLDHVLMHLVDLSFADLRGVIWHGVEFDGMTMVESNLAGLDLRGFDLSGILLGGADLRRAQLQGALLQDSALHFANLSGANLSGARLSGAGFWRADLTHADLRSADLRGVTFKRSRLEGVDFSEAVVDGLVGKQCDVEGARAVPQMLIDSALRSVHLPGPGADEDEDIDSRLDDVDEEVSNLTVDEARPSGSEIVALRLYADRHARPSVGRELLARVPDDRVWDWCQPFIRNMGGWYPVPSALWDRFPYLHLIEAIESEDRLLLFVRDVPAAVIDRLRVTLIGGDFERDAWLPQEPTVIFDSSGRDYEVQLLWVLPKEHLLLCGDSIHGRRALRQVSSDLDRQPPVVSLDDRYRFLQVIGNELAGDRDFLPWPDERIAEVLRLGRNESRLSEPWLDSSLPPASAIGSAVDLRASGSKHSGF